MAFPRFCYILVNLVRRPQSTGEKEFPVLSGSQTAARAGRSRGRGTRSCQGKARSDPFKANEGNGTFSVHSADTSHGRKASRSQQRGEVRGRAVGGRSPRLPFRSLCGTRGTPTPSHVPGVRPLRRPDCPPRGQCRGPSAAGCSPHLPLGAHPTAAGRARRGGQRTVLKAGGARGPRGGLRCARVAWRAQVRNWSGNCFQT